MDKEQGNHLEDLAALFARPTVAYRSVPFWSWNGRMEPEELRRQVADMDAHGMGGFFIHAREGLETSYMDERWMEAVAAAVEAARDAGLSAWIYDEDRWPSGAAGGLVPARGGDALRAKGVTIELLEGNYTPDGTALALFSARLEGLRVLDYRRLDPGTAHVPEPGQILLLFRQEVSLPSEWFNEESPSDNLNPDSARAFLDITYEAYKQHFGAEFGKTIPGFFTDEPNLANRHCRFPENRGFLPWTGGLDTVFAERHGYSLLDRLPALFLDSEDSPWVRHDYWKTITIRFCSAYTAQLADWCRTNNLKFTGHCLFENDLGMSVRVGGAVMPHYAHQDIPGIDMLTAQIHENLTVLQCASVAHQFGRERVLSETYGCTGWDFDFEGQKWMGDWQYALGINARCQHLALYSLRGCRKRDFPPAFSYQTCWWKYNGVVEDYFARLSAVLSQGIPDRNILLLHPLSTVWTKVGSEPLNDGWWKPDIFIRRGNAVGEAYNRLVRSLLGEHFDFDLGDELLLEEWGRVEGKTLVLNKAAYSVVVIPPVETLFSSTAERLRSFLAAGGAVLCMGSLPTRIDGRPDRSLESLCQYDGFSIVDGFNGLCTALEKLGTRWARIQTGGREAPQILCARRTGPDYDLAFVVNNDRESPCTATLSLEGTGRMEQWDPLTGDRSPLGPGDILLDLAPAESRLYVLDKTKSPAQPVAPVQKVLTGALGPACAVTRTAENALVLDRCAYRLTASPLSPEMDVWRAQQAIRETLGMRPVYYNGLPQRYRWAATPHPADGAPVELVFHFTVDWAPSTPVYLVLEEAGHYKIELNGRPVSAKPNGFYLDRSFDKIPLPALQPGKNRLVLHCSYTNDQELEDCYLVGDFGVSPERHIVAEPTTMHFGDWCLQGYFHYCGSLIYHLHYHHEGQASVFLELGDYSAVHVEVRLNGETVGHIPWRAANCVELRGLRQGENQIDLEVMGSPRNLFGPFHQAVGDVPRTDWRAFRTSGSDYTPGYVVKPYGLLGQVYLYRQEREESH